MEKLILTIINQGVSASRLDYQNRRIMYANVIYLCLPVVYLIFVLLDVHTYVRPLHELKWDQFIVVIEIFVCVAGIYLNKIGRDKLAKVIFIVTWPLLLHIIPITYQHAPPDYYFAYPAGIIFHSILIQIMFSYRTERSYLFVFIVLNFIMMLTSVKLMNNFQNDISINLNEMVQSPYYMLDIILYWLLFTMVSNFLVNSVDKLLDRLTLANQQIELQKEELSAINETLEATVQVRTARIEEQNKKLRDHAFYNAHILRGPFCRIKGLLLLQSLPEAEGDTPVINRYLNDAVNELNAVIGEIQKIVHDDEASV